MNEELIADLAEAMKRREKAQAAIARWSEQLNDANEDIQEMSARIAEYAPTTGNPEPEVEVEAETAAHDPWATNDEPRIWTPEQV
jgi:F0F1-type ATP synthase membrane subunit b/b'